MKITENISYIGSLNPGLRVFDIIMNTAYGTSYNSYLVKGEEYAIIETVHEDFTQEFLEKIEAHAAMKDIKYVILNHTEPDHSGSLKRIIELNPDILVIGSSAAIKNINNIINMSFNSRVVKQGDSLDLGNGVVLDFIIAPNLHWPDSMFTYLAKEKTIFTCDMFGCHFCEPMILDKYIKYPNAYLSELEYYYQAIFSPFKKFVLAGIEKIKDLEIETICTSHGPVLQERIQQVVESYRTWSAEPEQKKDIAIFYVSAYGYTEKMAKAFEEEFKANGIEVKSYQMLEHDMGEMTTALNEASAVLFGSPTINRDALKPIWDLIATTEVVTLKNKPALVFGSYGWSGEACKLLCDRLAGIKYKVFNDGVKYVFNPSQEDLDEIKLIAKDFSAQIK